MQRVPPPMLSSTLRRTARTSGRARELPATALEDNILEAGRAGQGLSGSSGTPGQREKKKTIAGKNPQETGHGMKKIKLGGKGDVGFFPLGLERAGLDTLERRAGTFFSVP